MKTIELLKILQTYPLFTENDLSKILNKNSAYIKNLLYRIRKRNLIYQIERGKYTLYDDPILFASYIYIPSYISLWTAFRYYNLTEQLPRTIFIMVPRSRKSLKFQNTLIKFIKTKYLFGFKKERYNNFDIFMAEPEKAVIDSLLSKKTPLDEVIKVIKTKKLNIKKLIRYAMNVKNKALSKRLGFILDENNISCNELKRFIDNNYIQLDPMLANTGKKNRKWRIIDNRR